MPVGLVIAIDESDATSHGFTSNAAKVVGLWLPGFGKGGTMSFCRYDANGPGL